MSGKASAFEYICAHAASLRLLFVGGVVGLLLTLASLVVFQPGTGPYVVSVLNLVGALFVIAFSGVFLWQCTQI